MLAIKKVIENIIPIIIMIFIKNLMKCLFKLHKSYDYRIHSKSGGFKY